MLNSGTNYFLVIISLFIGIILGGTGYSFISKNTNPIPQNLVSNQSTSDSIFTSQTATIQGKILKAERNKVTIQNLQNNQTREFEISPSLFIYKYQDGKSILATSSANLKLLDLNQEISANLEFSKGKYLVTMVIYPNLH